MVKSIKIGNLTIKGVFRHQWDNLDSDRIFHRIKWKTKEIGVFFRKDLCVGTDKKGKKMFDEGNLRPSYMVGINFIWVKMWIEISWKVLHLK